MAFRPSLLALTHGPVPAAVHNPTSWEGVADDSI